MTKEVPEVVGCITKKHSRGLHSTDVHVAACSQGGAAQGVAQTRLLHFPTLFEAGIIAELN